jgi:hypothetical protein
MENTVQEGPHIFAVTFGHLNENPGVALMINPAASVETKDGPVPGVVMKPAQARELAYVLLLHAEQLASSLVNVPEMPKS